MYTRYPYPDELYHYGVRGMKWGIVNDDPRDLITKLKKKRRAQLLAKMAKKTGEAAGKASGIKVKDTRYKGPTSISNEMRRSRSNELLKQDKKLDEENKGIKGYEKQLNAYNTVKDKENRKEEERLRNNEKRYKDTDATDVVKGKIQKAVSNLDLIRSKAEEKRKIASDKDTTKADKAADKANFNLQMELNKKNKSEGQLAPTKESNAKRDAEANKKLDSLKNSVNDYLKEMNRRATVAQVTKTPEFVSNAKNNNKAKEVTDYFEKKKKKK